MKKIINIVVASLLALTVTSALAQGPALEGQKKPAERASHRKQVKQRLMGQLNLTPAQQSEIKAIHQRAKEHLRAIRENKAQPAGKKAQVKAIRARAHKQMLAVLTPAQRQKLQALKAAAHARRGGIHKIQP